MLARTCARWHVSGHLAVLTKPYLEKIMAGQKTIESRFSKFRTPPFCRVQTGDIVFLKEVAGPVQAIALTSHVQFFGPLKAGEAERIMEDYQEELQLDSAFKERKHDSVYVTLIFFGLVLPVKALKVIKLDRRPWVVLKDEEEEAAASPTQLFLFTDNEDCKAGLHTYNNSRIWNAKGHPVCRFCGVDSIDWDRIHRCDLTDIDYTISQLHTEKFRFEWWMKELDQQAKNHALRKGLLNLRSAAFMRLKQSVGEVYEMPDGTKRPYRDGRQTPYSGNCLYYAQHALACCCRKCMRYWYGVPYGRYLNEEELTFFTELVLLYVKTKLTDIQEQGLGIPNIRAASDK